MTIYVHISIKSMYFVRYKIFVSVCIFKMCYTGTYMLKRGLCVLDLPRSVSEGYNHTVLFQSDLNNCWLYNLKTVFLLTQWNSCIANHKKMCESGCIYMAMQLINDQKNELSLDCNVQSTCSFQPSQQCCKQT